MTDLKKKNMDISNLITAENNVVIMQMLIIAKQDIALQTAINSLNELSHLNKIEFESYGKSYGINEELLAEIRSLNDKLQKAKYGRY